MAEYDDNDLVGRLSPEEFRVLRRNGTERPFTSELNGETRQDGTTDLMIFKIAETIEYITHGTSLRPGDVIATGTPSGVGDRMDPPTYLTPGDVCEVEIQGIGTLTTNIVARN